MLRWYRRSERRFVERLTSAAARLARRLGAIFSSFVDAGRHGISVLVVPATESRPRGFRISFFGAALGLLAAAALVSSIFLFGGRASGTSASIAESEQKYAAARDELDGFRDQVARLMDVYGAFNKALGTVVDALPASGAGSPDYVARLGSVFGPSRAGDEASQLAAVKATLLEATPLVREYGTALGKMGTVQKSIPSIWPIKGGVGHISTLFGYETNVFTGQRYFHQGIDASTYRRGDPIVATADGKVVLTANDRSYGLTVVIVHAQGFSTRYGHMDRILVRTGQSVKQGETIGILGNTGVSTGPHVHYEVMIGDKRTDPMNFLWLRRQ